MVMEYRKDKRTKNLTLRDIHVGDWVQEWSPTAERYSPPMKVSCINYDGTVYLVSDDENYCNPDETEIENVDALPITLGHLRGFGFEIEMFKNGDGKLRYNGEALALLHRRCEVGKDCGGILFEKKTDDYVVLGMMYMHELIAYAEDTFDVKIEWKGIER